MNTAKPKVFKCCFDAGLKIGQTFPPLSPTGKPVTVLLANVASSEIQLCDSDGIYAFPLSFFDSFIMLLRQTI